MLVEVKSSLPAIKGEAGGENFVDKYEEAIAELIREGKDLSEVCARFSHFELGKLNFFKENYN